MAAVLTQNANGSFPVTEEVSQILGVSLEVLIKEGAGVDPRAWVTLVCILFLTTHCQDEKIIWELVANKAEKWLSINFPAIGSSANQKARESSRTKHLRKSRDYIG